MTIFNQTIASNAITDNKGNTYTKVAESIKGTDHAAIFYAQNVTGGSSFQVTSSVDGTLAIHEYSGIATTGASTRRARLQEHQISQHRRRNDNDGQRALLRGRLECWQP